MVRFEAYSSDPIMNIGIIFSFILFSFLFFLFCIIILSFLKKEKNLKNFTPNISIIIPAYNEENNINNCLKSISHSYYSKDKIQIIVVDDESTDSTKEIVGQFIKENPLLDIILLKGTHQGKSKTLNLGMKYAKYDYILSLDADIKLNKNTIHLMISPLKNKKVGAANAVVLVENPKNIIEHFQNIEYLFNNLIRTSFSKIFGNTVWFFGAIACYKKKVIEEIGGFKIDTLTEDMDICLEIFRKGYRIKTVSEAQVFTKAMPTIKRLFMQRMRWYYGSLQALWKNREVLKKHFSIPVIFLFINQYWWTLFAFFFFPITAYQFYFWLPEGIFELLSYTFRWFSLLGPFYVIYKIPEWGISTLNLFGIMSGIITFIISIFGIISYKKISPWSPIILLFYFPYTILLNLIMISGVIYNLFSKKKYFIS